jgi:hypothetical protein
MFDWLPEGALPIGLLLFAGTLFAFARRRAGFLLAKKQLPELAPRLGLRFKEPTYRRTIGSLTGRLDGYSVIVDPDDQRAIIVRFQDGPKLELRTYEHFTGTPHGLRHFRSGRRRFDGFFKTRYVSDEVARRLEAVTDLGRLVEPFKGAYYRQIKSLTITAAGVTCVFDFGTPPYIPAGAVEQLLPAMLALAKVVAPDAKLTSEAVDPLEEFSVADRLESLNRDVG